MGRTAALVVQSSDFRDYAFAVAISRKGYVRTHQIMGVTEELRTAIVKHLREVADGLERDA